MGRKKLTIEIVKQQIEDIHENITVLINQPYVNTYSKIKYICKFHGEKIATPNSLKSGKGCYECNGTPKLTIEIVKQQIEAIHENITIPIDQEYINNKIKIKYICKYHGEKSATPHGLKSGRGCIDCGGTQKLTIEIVKQQIEEINENITVPIDQVYTNNYTKIKYICKYHGEKTASPAKLKQGQGCSECAGLQKLTIEIIKQRAESINSNITVPNQPYINSGIKIKYICKYHGEKSATPDSLKSGKGCPECSIEQRAKNLKSNWFEVIKNIEFMNENIMIPVNQPYINSGIKIKYICKFHGEKFATTDQLKKGSNCRACAHELNLFTRAGWIKGCKKYNGKAEIYWIKMTYKNQSWYKFGITYKGLEKRFQAKEYKDIKIFLIGKVNNKPPEYIWDLEHRLHKFYRKSRIKPPIEFSGDNECYKIVNENLNLQSKRL